MRSKAAGPNGRRAMSPRIVRMRLESPAASARRSSSRRYGGGMWGGGGGAAGGGRARHADDVGGALAPDEVEGRRPERQARHVAPHRADAAGKSCRLGPPLEFAQVRRVHVEGGDAAVGQELGQIDRLAAGAAG